MDDPKAMATRAALRKMFREGGYFDICTIDNLVKMNGTIPNGDVYATTRPLHCVHFKDMEPDLAKWLMDETLKMFGGPSLDLKAIEDVRPDKFIIHVHDVRRAPTEKRGVAQEIDWSITTANQGA